MKICWTQACGVMLLLGMVQGCVGTTTQLAPIPKGAVEAEQERQKELALREHRQQESRLDSIAYPILAGATAFCPDALGPRYGLRVATIHNYDEKWRPAAAAALALSDTVSILEITPESPAAAAGLVPGDRILSVGSKTIQPGVSAVADFSAAFDAQPETGNSPTRIIIDRHGRRSSVSLIPNRMCAYPTLVDVSSDLNAYADGKNIVVTSTMMRFTTDEELRVVVAHEFAHNAMGHLKARKKNSLFGALLGALGDLVLASRGVNTGGYYASRGAMAGAMSFSQDFEREADYVGLYALAAANLPLESAPTFWRHMAQENPKSITLAYTHPTTAERFVRMEQEIVEIQRKQARGLALRPELKKPDASTLRPDAEPENVFAVRAPPVAKPSSDPQTAGPERSASIDTPVIQTAATGSNAAALAPQPEAGRPAESTSRPSPDVGDLAASATVGPSGTTWVASLSQRLYYPASCPAVKELPEQDRLYYSTEDGPIRGEFRKSIVCN